MKVRVLLSAMIGAVVAMILYPAADVAARVTVLAVSFFLLLGILFCTMLIRPPTGSKASTDDETHAAQKGASGGGKDERTVEKAWDAIRDGRP